MVVPDKEEILDIDQLSRYLKVPKATLYRLAAEGKIPSHKVGRHWRFRRQSVDLWLDRPGEVVLAGEGE
jgi:excisionase family DNA binding protein